MDRGSSAAGAVGGRDPPEAKEASEPPQRLLSPGATSALRWDFFIFFSLWRCGFQVLLKGLQGWAWDLGIVSRRKWLYVLGSVWVSKGRTASKTAGAVSSWG